MDNQEKLDLLADLEHALYDVRETRCASSPSNRFMIFITAKAMGVSPILLRKWVECDFGELGSGMHVTVDHELVKIIRDNETFLDFVSSL